MHYDPMIAKLVVRGEDRFTALIKMKDCLSKFQVHSVQHIYLAGLRAVKLENRCLFPIQHDNVILIFTGESKTGKLALDLEFNC